MTAFTVFGATGFIGRHLVDALRRDGHTVQAIGRDIDFSAPRHLGRVIYAAGATGGAATGPIAMLDVHATLLEKAITHFDFDSFVYLSSTRVYGLEGQATSTREDARLSCSPQGADWFALTKLCGESLCLGSRKNGVSVARLSNIYGANQHPSTFLAAVRRDCIEKNAATINETPQSCKDYLSIDDATRYLAGLATSSAEGIYNVASGALISHQDITEALQCMGYAVSFNPQGADRRFPRVDTGKITGLFGAPRHSLINDLPALFGKPAHA